MDRIPKAMFRIVEENVLFSSSPFLSLTLFFESKVLINPKVIDSSQCIQPALGISCLCLPSAGFSGSCYLGQLLHGLWGSRLFPHACMTNNQHQSISLAPHPVSTMLLNKDSYTDEIIMSCFERSFTLNQIVHLFIDQSICSPVFLGMPCSRNQSRLFSWVKIISQS